MPEFNSETSLGRLVRWMAGRRPLDFKQLARESLTLAAIVLVAVLIEMLGRWHASEFMDLASALTLALVVAVCFSWHRRLRLRWTRRAGRLAQAGLGRLRWLRFQWGLDLRRQPPIRRGLPPVLVVLPLALLGIIAAAALWATLVGTPSRPYVAGISYVVYLALTASLWAGLLSVLIVAAFLPAWMVFDIIKAHLASLQRHAQRIGWAIVIVYFALLISAALALPSWVATAVLGAAVALAASLPWLLRTWYPDCVWRAPGDAEIRSLSLGTLFSWQLTIVALVPLALVLLALGPEALGAEAYAEAPISTSLGRVAAWLSGGGLLVFLGLLAVHMGISRWHDPSRPSPTSVFVDGALDRREQTQIRQQLADAGFQVKFAPAVARRSDVRIAVGETLARDPADSRLNEVETTIAFTLDELSEPAAGERIARRDVIQRRRHLLRGLRTIFRSAAARRGRSGCGFWVAPQFWFVDGLTRDQFDDEDTNMLDVIPPLYYRALPRPARGHFFDVTRALEVDLIFVEDGVGYRGLRRVLRVMFERYDIDGGRQRLSEIHFAGLPKLRVILHDYDFQQPLMKSKYPEPSYQHLGRVRILHVFRDRGEGEEVADVPEAPESIFTPDDAPVLVG